MKLSIGAEIMYHYLRGPETPLDVKLIEWDRKKTRSSLRAKTTEDWWWDQQLIAGGHERWDEDAE